MVTKNWGNLWGGWGGWDGNEDVDDPDRNKGKTGAMPAAWTDEQRSKVEHIECPDCSATVYASGYMVRDKCDVCWAPFPDETWHMPVSDKAKKNNASAQGTHSKYKGSYSKSRAAFAKLHRSSVHPTDKSQEHLLSKIYMPSLPTKNSQDRASNESQNTSDIHDETKHVTKDHSSTMTNADEYLSSTSEAYTHEVVQDMELFVRAVQLAVKVKPSTENNQLSLDKQADLRSMIETMMGQFGTAVGHKIGDDWFLRDTTEEAKDIQIRATSKYDQPMYGAALYGDEGETTDRQDSLGRSSMKLISEPDLRRPDDTMGEMIIREKIRSAIKKTGTADALSEVATEVALAKNDARMSVMQEKLLPLIQELLEQAGGEPLDQDEANEAIDEAMGGCVLNPDGTESKARAQEAKGKRADDEYIRYLRDYMNSIGDEIRKEREELAKRKSREDKWTQSAKNIAKAYGHDAHSAYSVFDALDPLFEFSSKSPKQVPLTFKAQQMLASVDNERRVTWEESGETTDRMVELNFGNLKVFRQEDTFSPQLLIGVDVSGSTGCIHNAGLEGQEGVGSLMWEVAATISSAGTEANTTQYAYHSTQAGFLTTIEVPRGMRPICRCDSRLAGKFQEHGGGTPELAMLHYLNDKAQASGDLSSTTVILIVDGNPDEEIECKKMSEELVAAGVQFGVVICGTNYGYWGTDDGNYYNASVAVTVQSKSDVDEAIPKLMSLIQARGLA